MALPYVFPAGAQGNGGYYEEVHLQSLRMDFMMKHRVIRTTALNRAPSLKTFRLTTSAPCAVPEKKNLKNTTAD